MIRQISQTGFPLRSAVVAATRDSGAFALVAGSKGAALILALAPGACNALATAANGTSTGVALVEIFELPE